MRRIAATIARGAVRGRIGLLVVGAVMLLAPATASASIVYASQAGTTLVAQNTGVTAETGCYPIWAENGSGYLPCQEPTFSGATWYSAVTADGGRGNGAYYQMPGSQWVGQYGVGSLPSYGTTQDWEWTQFKTFFDRPAGASLGIRVLVDNEVTGIFVNGNQLSSCTRANPCGGFANLPYAISIPDGDLQATNNELKVTVLNNFPNAVTSGGLDFQVVTRGPFVLQKAPDVSGKAGNTITTSGSFQESFDADKTTPISITADNSVGTFVDHGDGTWTWTYPSSQAGSGTIHVTATDANGLSANDSFNYSVAPPPDSTPPVITPTVSGTQGNGGWYTSDVGVSWSVTDPESAISSESGCADQSVTSDTSGVTVTCTATSAGGTASKSATIKRDATPPGVSVSHSVDGQNGWNVSSPVTETVNASDFGSGLAGAPSCTVGASPATLTQTGIGTWTFKVSDDGKHDVSCTASDNAGNQASGSDSVKVDRVPPSTSASGVPSGWVNHGVTVSLSASDPSPGSGVAATYYAVDGGQAQQGNSVTVSAPSDHSDDGAHQVSYWSADNAGNTEARQSATVKIDTAPPSVSVSHSADGQNGWNVTSPVTETVNASDTGSGLAGAPACTVDGNAATLTPATADGSWTFPVPGDGQHAVSCQASDNAGNQGSGGDSTKIDTTPPVVSYAGNAGTYTVADSVSITCSASDPQPGSGMASDTCQNISGDAYTFSLGTNSYSATGTDNAGNVGKGQTSFQVTVDTDSLCTLTQRWVTNPGIAGALCAKLDATKASIARGDTSSKDGQLGAYRDQLSAQSAKSIPADKAAILTKLSQAI